MAEHGAPARGWSALSALSALSRTAPSVGGHLDFLDGVRGIALLLVVASHASLIGMHLVPGVDMSGTGKVGVWLFFVLSAFLLVHQALHLDAEGRLDGRSWARYALRRVLRIYPLYIVFLVACWLVPFEDYFGPFGLRDVLAHLAVREGRWHTWSIAVELKWYLVLPLVVLGYVHLARRNLAIATVLLALLVWSREVLPMSTPNDALRTYLVIFLCGAWVAMAHRALSARAARVASPRLAAFAATVALVILALVFAMTPSLWSRLQGTEVPLGYWHRDYLLFGALWGAFLLALLHAPTWLQRAFGWWPLRVLGVISYSAYLWHGPILLNLGWLPVPPSHPLAVALTMAFIVLVSSVSYLCIERPFLRVRRKARPT